MSHLEKKSVTFHNKRPKRGAIEEKKSMAFIQKRKVHPSFRIVNDTNKTRDFKTNRAN